MVWVLRNPFRPHVKIYIYPYKLCCSSLTLQQSKGWYSTHKICKPGSQAAGLPSCNKMTIWGCTDAFFKHNFMYFLTIFAAMGLRWGTQAFSSCGEETSHCSGFSCSKCGLKGTRASAVTARGLSSWGPLALEHRLRSGVQASGPSTDGTLLGQGWNPCLPHWQVDSLPLNHQGSPNLALANRNKPRLWGN